MSGSAYHIATYDEFVEEYGEPDIDLEAVDQELRSECKDEMADRAMEIVMYIVEKPSAQIRRLDSAAKTYSASKLYHGLKCFSTICDDIEDVDNLKGGRSNANTWRFGDIREALEQQYPAST